MLTIFIIITFFLKDIKGSSAEGTTVCGLESLISASSQSGLFIASKQLYYAVLLKV